MNMISKVQINSAPSARRGLKLLLAVKRNPLAYFTRLMQEEGPYAWLSLGGKKLLMLNDATGIQHVLQDNFEFYRKGSFYQVLKPLLGDGIFLSEGSLWQKQRRESAPVFAGGNFADMTEQMAAATSAMMARWEPRIAKGEPIDIHAETMWLSLDIFLRALFHQPQNNIAENMKSSMGTLLGEAESRIWSFLCLPQRLMLRLPKYQTALRFLDHVVAELIVERKKNASYPEDLLSRLIKSYDLSHEGQKGLRDQIISFLLAGHETTANGLAWTFYQLALHPSVQTQVAEEAAQALGGDKPDFQTLKNLTYTRQAFNEALRLYPPVWTMSREALHDDTIPLEDGSRVTIERGTSIMLCVYAIHRRSTYWQHPEAFDPGRFHADMLRKRHKFAWLPFSGGPRLCLGLRFAEIESLVTLAMVTQKYQLTLLPGQDIRPEPIITLRPNGPMLFNITERIPLKSQSENFTLPARAIEERPLAEICPFRHQKT